MKKLIVKNLENVVIGQTQGTDDEVQLWLQGNIATSKYGLEGEYTVETIDVTALVKEQAEVEDRTKSRLFCVWVIDKIAAYNKKNLSQSQVQAIFTNPTFGAITLALLTGATKTARDLIAQVGPTLYPQPFVTEIVLRFDEQLAKEAAEEASENPPVLQPETPENESPTEGESNTGAQ